MPPALIGVTTHRARESKGHPVLRVMESYVQALSRAGACPVLIPLGLPETALQALCSRLDGILFTGGGDVEPQRYGSRPHPLVSEPDPDRDRVEIQLLQDAVKAGLPFLGICRGLQVINVALGGSLYEDVLDQHPQAIRHQYYEDHPRNYLAHPIRIEAGSRLAQIMDSGAAQVNSLHHQGIRRLAPGLRASAFAPDNIIEGLELPEHGFGLAVQWHPEWLQEHAAQRALFKAFVQAAEEK